MTISPARIDQIILNQLKDGDRRVLSLVVSTRRVLNQSGSVKGDLSARVQSALSKLVASGTIVDVDGSYSLNPAKTVVA